MFTWKSSSYCLLVLHGRIVSDHLLILLLYASQESCDQGRNEATHEDVLRRQSSLALMAQSDDWGRVGGGGGGVMLPEEKPVVADHLSWLQPIKLGALCDQRSIGRSSAHVPTSFFHEDMGLPHGRKPIADACRVISNSQSALPPLLGLMREAPSWKSA